MTSGGNAFAPASYAPMTERRLNNPQMRGEVPVDSAVGLLAEPEHVAGLVLFLASELVNVTTG